jgi:hypothetical protein
VIVTHRASPRGQHRRISRSTSPECAMNLAAHDLEGEIRLGGIVATAEQL